MLKKDTEFFGFDVAFILEGYLRQIGAGRGKLAPSFPSLFVAKGRASHICIEKKQLELVTNKTKR